MTPTVGLLYSAVKENNQRLKSITEGMSLEEVEYKGPNNNFNSTAQLINHLSYVDLKWVYRIKGESLPPSLEEKYGPALDAEGRLPMIKNKSLGSLVSDYEEIIKMLKETCTQLRDADLERATAFGHDNEKQATIRWGIWHIADHSRYHQANINLLRRWYVKET
ncbi:DinB family protein [Salibacterium aidingense]|uniref:DinB family protein n=1 Tax=Salibacterium aidingense TaxID=384933 RepID=UPI000478B8C3|nr:DinB family protein [Salibacterium aidingense]